MVAYQTQEGFSISLVTRKSAIGGKAICTYTTVVLAPKGKIEAKKKRPN